MWRFGTASRWTGLDLALLFQHVDGPAQCRNGVFEFRFAVGGGNEAAGAGAEIDTVRHHRQPQFVNDIGLAFASQSGGGLLIRVEFGGLRSGTRSGFVKICSIEKVP